MTVTGLMVTKEKTGKKDNNFLEESNSKNHTLRFLPKKRDNILRLICGQATEPPHPSNHFIPGNHYELTTSITQSTYCRPFLSPTWLVPD